MASVPSSVQAMSGRARRLPIYAGMLGVIPFYGALALVYVPLTALFGWRLRKFLCYSIALQRALFGVLLSNCAYVVLAFAYYLHLNLDTNASSQAVYGGIYSEATGYSRRPRYSCGRPRRGECGGKAPVRRRPCSQSPTRRARRPPRRAPG